MVTDDDIQSFRFMGEPHEGDGTVIELGYVNGATACVVLPNALLPALVEALRTASDAAEAAKAGVAIGVMRPQPEPHVTPKVVGEPVEGAGWLVRDIKAYADDTNCVVLTFEHGRHNTDARMVADAARLLAAHAASRADLN